MHHNFLARQLRRARIAQVHLCYPENRWSRETNVTSSGDNWAPGAGRTVARFFTSMGTTLSTVVSVLECAVLSRGALHRALSAPASALAGARALSTGWPGDAPRMLSLPFCLPTAWVGR